MADRSNDPDETEGRAMFRARANVIARAQLALMRRNTALKPPPADGRERRRLRGEPCGE